MFLRLPASCHDVHGPGKVIYPKYYKNSNEFYIFFFWSGQAVGAVLNISFCNFSVIPKTCKWAIYAVYYAGSEYKGKIREMKIFVCFIFSWAK